MTDQTPDLAAIVAAVDEFGQNLAAAARRAWPRVAAALTPTQDEFVLVPNDVAAAAVIPARRALAACLDGDDQHAAELLDGLDADQLYAIEAAASGLAIHASRLRKALTEAEQQQDAALADWERDLLAAKAAEQQDGEPAPVNPKGWYLGTHLAEQQQRADTAEAETARERARANTAEHRLDIADRVNAALKAERDKARRECADATRRAEQAERRAEHFEEHAAQVDADLGIETQRADKAERRYTEQKRRADEQKARAQRAEAEAADWRTTAHGYEQALHAEQDKSRLLANDLAQERRAAQTYRAQRDAAREDAETAERRLRARARDLATTDPDAFREWIRTEIRSDPEWWRGILRRELRAGFLAEDFRRVGVTVRDSTGDPDAWRP